MTPSRSALGRVWRDIWYEPVAAERLALIRVTTCIALVADILLMQLPWFDALFGAQSFEPHGYSDRALLRSWRWTAYFFDVQGSSLLMVFVAWLSLLVLFALGVRTRLVAVAVWLLSMAMLNRHYHLKNFGDSALRFSLFMLVFTPSHLALSWDAWRPRRSLSPTTQSPWGVRLFQLQLCALYCSTGLSKLIGPLSSTWYQGTSLHYALNDFVLARVASPLLPAPLWLTLPLTYLVLAWEVLFIPLVIWRPTRAAALTFGVVFHVLTFLLFEIGWFGFYVLTWYCAWIPDEWFTRVFYPRLWSLLPTTASARRAPT